MNPVVFDQVSFAYDEDLVLRDLSLSVPPGITSLTGPNGAGKSTFLLLASGRLIPSQGSVMLLGTSTQGLEEAERNRLCSLVFQNMEFETEEPLGDLLNFVFSQGFLPAGDHEFVTEVIKVFELDGLLLRKTQALSKGEMQRAVMAFSLLYGSRVVVMDEPVFALEDDQKHRALSFLSESTKDRGLSFLYSVHELDLTRRYSDQVLLFSKGGNVRLGAAEDLLTRESLEEAYQVPYALLHQKEKLYRSSLLTADQPKQEE